MVQEKYETAVRGVALFAFAAIEEDELRLAKGVWVWVCMRARALL